MKNLTSRLLAAGMAVGLCAAMSGSSVAASTTGEGRDVSDRRAQLRERLQERAARQDEVTRDRGGRRDGVRRERIDSARDGASGGEGERMRRDRIDRNRDRRDGSANRGAHVHRGLEQRVRQLEKRLAELRKRVDSGLIEDRGTLRRPGTERFQRERRIGPRDGGQDRRLESGAAPRKSRDGRLQREQRGGERRIERRLERRDGDAPKLDRREIRRRVLERRGIGSERGRPEGRSRDGVVSESRRSI